MSRGRAAGDNGPVMNGSAAARLRDGIVTLTRPSGPLPRPTRRGLAFDVVLALAFCIVSVYYGLSAGTGRSQVLVDGVTQVREGASTWFGAVAPMLLCSVPLVLRRRFPLAVLWVVLVAGLMAPDNEARAVFYAFVIATYSAVAYSPYRVPALASVPVALLVLNGAGAVDVPTIPDEYVPLLVLIPLAIAANGLRTWNLRADERQTRMAELEHARDKELRRAAERERARIARELHDVVTHNVSMMVIQAGAARKVMDSDPDETREALLAVEAGGRAAMAELRHTMGLLTMASDADASSDEYAPATSEGLAPQPGLDQLESLVGRVRDVGVVVELTVRGEPYTVTSGVGLAAYRVVQEALTNTVKHAAGASAHVLVEYGADNLYVEVTDTGGKPSASVGNGRGLLGLRERLTVYGGTLHTGAHPGGGFRVAALIPLETS